MSLTAAVFPFPGCGKRKRPNVILVITDDQGYGDLGCHGNPVIQTPNFDDLYTTSVRLTNFHVGPTCAPTRASLMTGRYCNRTGVWHTVMGRSLLCSDEVTIADVFKKNDYRTGIFGKWHLGDNYPFQPQYRGFDEVLVHGGGGVGQVPDYWDNDYFDDTYWHNGVPKKYDGYCTDVWFREAIKFIESNKERSFFCYLTTNAPHSPFHVEEKYSKPYKDKGVPDARARFYGMIANIDENLAVLRSKLRELGLEDNTIFIYMTDNGTSTGVDLDENGFPVNGFNAGMRGKKGSEYDGGHRVPCFIRWPGGGLDEGRDVEQLTAHVDLLPTLIDLCQIKFPDVKFDGQSIKPLLYDGPWQERLLVTDSQRLEYPVKWRKSAVMSDKWRLINGVELYNMESDHGQRIDVASAHPRIVEKFRAAYESWWKSVSEQFDEYCETVIGADSNVVRLTCHDWHGVGLPDEGRLNTQRREVIPPWNQPDVRRGVRSNGFWALYIAADGEYEFSLRRWPLEVNRPINAPLPAGSAVPGGVPLPEGVSVNPVKAGIQIGGVEWEKPVQSGDREAKFSIRLKRGQIQLKTRFVEQNGSSLGAYYVYVKKIK
ncbi:arylsulfatase [candidate division KSB1 bacterium]|nr:arylsulfatase [candidate division KSB1 bacterium]